MIFTGRSVVSGELVHVADERHGGCQYVLWLADFLFDFLAVDFVLECCSIVLDAVHLDFTEFPVPDELHAFRRLFIGLRRLRLSVLIFPGRLYTSNLRLVLTVPVRRDVPFRIFFRLFSAAGLRLVTATARCAWLFPDARFLLAADRRAIGVEVVWSALCVRHLHRFLSQHPAMR